ncbi:MULTISPECIES: hypothetical protein [Pseudomonas aeruginosa group]|uniref:hypothetical protein n=1 Tax=Pseudomonas aeruginosa group TaxID=136841 RepID=UPI0008FB1FFB|nr:MULTISPECIES: hypothetical protein [Pseudomonas aeruginosa group]AVR65497.1 hypothetical protein B7D75_00245 [Pseudomonas paraeruginosa]MBG3907661.1 hypothetical protein [Pseudomonas aeruginosa]MBG4205766.1 hypothetical protein [Pseudomonas aeruginosa]MBG4283086.1 hypothetical protein [Pseudomonas aeruginosa]MBG6894136.1 hypothetical protein [Pseudomonas aeruginosa]
MGDQELYQKIGKLLVDAGPADAREIIVRAELFSEGDGGKYEFDYVDQSGEFNWFDPDGRAVGDLTELLVQLRDYFSANNLTAGEGGAGCVIKLHVDEMKFGIEFNYGK